LPRARLFTKARRALPTDLASAAGDHAFCGAVRQCWRTAQARSAEVNLMTVAHEIYKPAIGRAAL